MIRTRGFAARLGLATSALIAIVCVGQSWVLGRRSLDHIRGFLVERGQSAAARLASEASPRLASNKLDALEAVAERAGTESGIVYVRVLDAQGLVLASMGNRPAGSPITLAGGTASAAPVAVGTDVWEFQAPIPAPPRRTYGQPPAAGSLPAEPALGTVTVGLSFEALGALRRRTLTTATLFAAAFAAFAVLAAVLLARAITRPVQALAAAAARVAHGDFAARVEVSTRDEIGALADAFNAMAESLGRSREALEEKVVELEEANHLKSEFLATVSHELRTPLNVIIGYADMLAESESGLGPEQAGLVAAIRRYSALQLGLITSVLDFARLSSGQVSFHVERFSLGTLLTETQALFTPHLRSARVTLTVALDADLPELETDRVKLQSILHNLLDNAVKFTEKGSIAVRARPGTQAGWVAIEVADTGVGIGAAELESIFEAFRQVGASSTRATGGMGLGLSIVKQLAAALGGMVTASSRPGKGSEFRVEIPSRLADANDAAAAVRALDGTAANVAALPARAESVRTAKAANGLKFLP